METKRRKRFDLMSILKDPVLKRELLTSLIKDIQNREGINTTMEQAKSAYDKVEKGVRV
jgi:ribosomal protein L17